MNSLTLEKFGKNDVLEAILEKLLLLLSVLPAKLCFLSNSTKLKNYIQN